MRLKLLFDMNLTPRFAAFFQQREVEARHWSTIGSPCAPDEEIMKYAADNGYVVVSLDLDFGAILAATQAFGPSVVQLRTREAISKSVFETTYLAINQVEDDLLAGAILTIDMDRLRMRMLPLR
ncbi:MAG: DUF5615 family PIN-like protein [Coriobacteriales bacterium]|jgi:predicted nuclease of predicted toxin-antitoxin system|nr:DUF5615 family PIN-like protein [Coriobacteriales bacterium]